MTSSILRHSLLLCALCVPALAFAQPATENSAKPECAQLSGAQEIVRAGTTSFFIKDGDQHYQVGMSGSCDSLPMASRLEISTDGQADRLCGAGTRVKTNRASCDVSKVTPISAEEFERRKARSRR